LGEITWWLFYAHFGAFVLGVGALAITLIETYCGMKYQ
jgi:hypothetical protein